MDKSCAVLWTRAIDSARAAFSLAFIVLMTVLWGAVFWLFIANVMGA